MELRKAKEARELIVKEDYSLLENVIKSIELAISEKHFSTVLNGVLSQDVKNKLIEAGYQLPPHDEKGFIYICW